MPTVAVNAPKSPVTKGSQSVAVATLPNLCKMPPPPPPFLPTPLPNIGQSSKQPQGYTTTVKVEGQPVAIRGASFGSSGDVASKGSGGGIVSSNAEGPTTFVAPGSLDVQFEGKNVQLLGDQMLNNCGPGGSPPNSATMAGVLHGPVVTQAADLGVYNEVKELCDKRCECKAEKQAKVQLCIDKKMYEQDRATGFTKRTKTEVPYDMSTDPPTPYMYNGKKYPNERMKRQTRNWRIPGSKRPDAVIVRDPKAPWTRDNILALVECKWGSDDWSLERDQERAYGKIAGNRDKLVELNDENCLCPEERERERVPVPVPHTAPSSRKEKAEGWEPPLMPQAVKPAATAIAAIAAIGIAILLAPEVAAAAAAVACLGLLGSSPPAGRGYDGV
jgi:uncharacterized Zn-binding protein involved in type VI secretion